MQGHGSPLIVHLEVSWDCNHKCVFCYNDWRIQESLPTYPSLENVRRMIDVLSTKDVIELVITGGEPTMRKDICEILCYASPLFPYVRLNTNGARLNKQLLKVLCSNQIDVLFSLHSASDVLHKEMVGKDDFHIVTSNLKKLLANGVDVSVMFVANKLNLHELLPTAKFLDMMGVKRLSLSRVCYFGDPRETYKKLRLTRKDIAFLNEQCHQIVKETNLTITLGVALPICSGLVPSDRIRHIVCGAGTTMAAVSPDGRLRICPQFHEGLGSIFEEKAWEYWAHYFTLRKALPRFCSSCPIARYCSQGCRAVAFYESGSIRATDPLVGSMRRKERRKLKELIEALYKELPLRETGLSRESFSLRSDTLFRKSLKGNVLFRRGFSPVLLNETASEIVQFLLKKPHSASEIAKRLSASYGRDYDLTLKDVVLFLGHISEFLETMKG